MPVDGISEFQPLVSEEIESAVGDVVSGDQYGLTFFDVSDLQLFGNVRVEDSGEKVPFSTPHKAREPLCLEFRRFCFRRSHAIDELERLLLPSAHKLRKRHSEQSSEIPLGKFHWIRSFE